VSAGARRVVLAIDPGRAKCGLAVCEPGRVLAQAVVDADALAARVADWQTRYGVTEVVIGDRTGAADAERALAPIVTAPIRRIDEAGTTLGARERYFKEHPPRGWRRLVPRGLLVPPVPYDDYAAVLLAEAALGDASR
jgi:RNase H-fold protein (predicted Holliday junction resolvase)